MLDQGKFDEFVISDNIDFFEELAKRNININFKYNTGKEKFSLEDVLHVEHFMQDAAEDIKSKNFSPLEELIAVYDIAKVFKEFKDAPSEFLSESRSLYEYLNNEYMVCAGYSDLIVNLGHRLGNPYSEIGLAVNGDGKEVTEYHSRNYVNIVDVKYGIDGFYALDATWEQSGRLGYGKSEATKSTYREFLLTTDEGRNNSDPFNKIDIYSYDPFFTCETPQELRENLEARLGGSNTLFEQLKVLDPEFYQIACKLDLSKDEDANVILEYLKNKINKTVPKENLLDAIIAVKRSIYVNYTEKDFEDMKMAYSITSPFRKNDLLSRTASLYGDKYDEYIQKRYEEIKSSTISEAKKSNPELFIYSIINPKMKEMIEDDKRVLEHFSGNKMIVRDKRYIEQIKSNLDEIQEAGFSIKEPDECGGNFYITFPEDDENVTIEQKMENLGKNKKTLYKILGLEEKGIVQRLGEETLLEQYDTIGKLEVSNQMSIDIFHGRGVVQSAEEKL